MSLDEEPSQTDLHGVPIRDTALNRWLTLLALRIFSKKRWWSSIAMLPLGFVVKRGSSNYHHLSEANTMQFVAKHTKIPVPKVYCSFVKDDDIYIVMKKMKGEWLGVRWQKCSDESKKKLLAS